MSSGPKGHSKDVYKRSPFDSTHRKKTDKYLCIGLIEIMAPQSADHRTTDVLASFTPYALHQEKDTYDGYSLVYVRLRVSKLC